MTDTERLDWYETHPFKVQYATGFLGGKNSWAARIGDRVEPGFTLRDAIDAAMEDGGTPQDACG